MIRIVLIWILILDLDFSDTDPFPDPATLFKHNLLIALRYRYQKLSILTQKTKQKHIGTSKLLLLFLHLRTFQFAALVLKA